MSYSPSNFWTVFGQIRVPPRGVTIPSSVSFCAMAWSGSPFARSFRARARTASG